MSYEVSEDLLKSNANGKNEKVEQESDFGKNGVDAPTAAPDACYQTALFAGDAFIASVLVAPLVVAVWRGTWGLMDLHHRFFPHTQSVVLGIIIHVCFAIVKAQLLARSTGAWSDDEGGAGRWLRERVLSKIYTYVFILACIMHWRGLWGLFDATIVAILPNNEDPHRPVLIMAFMILFFCCLLGLRSARNLLAPPYFVVTDGKEPTYDFTTRYRKTTNSRETILYVLDCVFSVAVVGSLVILLWRGLWALLEIYLYPEDNVKSLYISLIVGYTLVTLTFALQTPLRWTAARLHGASKLLLADVYHLLSFVATINLWRAVWGLLDVYLFPDTPKLSNWLSHGVSLIFLMLLNCSNSVLVRGVYIDAEEPAGECVVFPCHYLRLFFHRERIKKRHRRALAAAARQSEDPTLAPLQLSIVQEKV